MQYMVRVKKLCTFPFTCYDIYLETASCSWFGPLDNYRLSYDDTSAICMEPAKMENIEVILSDKQN